MCSRRQSQINSTLSLTRLQGLLTPILNKERVGLHQATRSGQNVILFPLYIFSKLSSFHVSDTCFPFTEVIKFPLKINSVGKSVSLKKKHAVNTRTDGKCQRQNCEVWSLRHTAVVVKGSWFGIRLAWVSISALPLDSSVSQLFHSFEGIIPTPQSSCVD